MSDEPRLAIARAAPLSRRLLVKTSLSVGFCAAIPTVLAQVITTPADGLIAGEVRVPAGDADIPAYRAMPDHGGPFPTVLVVHEVFGVHEHIKDICRRFARLGYYAISPELFARQGDAVAESDMGRLMTEIVFKKPDAEAASDLDATLAYAKSTSSADVERAAVVGFCWGGRQVWLYATHNPSLNVAWYGPLFWRIQQPTAIARAERDPPDIVADLKVPVLGFYGGQDGFIPLAQIDEMKAKLAAASGAKIIVYPDAGHGFFADYREDYSKADAEASWSEATHWLKAHGV
ncbi:MAG TPA: dienelactone hydrolase family protein [Roseiarcus sp.]